MYEALNHSHPSFNIQHLKSNILKIFQQIIPSRQTYLISSYFYPQRKEAQDQI